VSGKSERDNSLINALIDAYPDARCELNYISDFELLVAVILSAQCTDRRVNLVTRELFEVANAPKKILELGEEALAKIIYPCGFYKVKAANIIDTARVLDENYNGKVPNDFDSLIKLKGVGRKTANVVMGELFNSGGVAVDTHVFRVSRRLGLASGNTVEKVELELAEKFKGLANRQIHHAMIFHGRYCCKSRNPECGRCRVREFCKVVEK